MKRPIWREHGTIIYGALIASAIVALLSLMGFLVLPTSTTPLADMRIEPERGHVRLGETFTIDVVVSADVPVNVFRGTVEFDPALLAVESIDYNTSIADLWAELPWYENGEGTVNFGGGTTRPGGFIGTGELVSITFYAKERGETLLTLADARVLAHDGLGSEVPLSRPLDALFEVEESVIDAETVAVPEKTIVSLQVVPDSPETDLNGDGKRSMADVSLFLLNMWGGDPRYDFNGDGSVNGTDLSILMDSLRR